MANWSNVEIKIYNLNVFDISNIRKLFTEQQDEYEFIHKYTMTIDDISISMSSDKTLGDIYIYGEGRWYCKETSLINDLLKLVPKLNMLFIEYGGGSDFIQIIEYKNGEEIRSDNDVVDSPLGLELLGEEFFEERDFKEA